MWSRTAEVSITWRGTLLPVLVDSPARLLLSNLMQRRRVPRRWRGWPVHMVFWGHLQSEQRLAVLSAPVATPNVWPTHETGWARSRIQRPHGDALTLRRHRLLRGWRERQACLSGHGCLNRHWHRAGSMRRHPWKHRWWRGMLERDRHNPGDNPCTCKAPPNGLLRRLSLLQPRKRHPCLQLKCVCWTPPSLSKPLWCLNTQIHLFKALHVDL